jgi:predicted alpha-1,6-mannanase (GH76 family)
MPRLPMPRFAVPRFAAAPLAVVVAAAAALLVTASPSFAAPECPPSCDGQDAATAQGDREPVPAAAVLGRTVKLHVSDPDDLGWASVTGGAAGDQVWLDRTWNGGANWDGHTGLAAVPAGSTATRTAMYQLDDKPRHRIGALRACARPAGAGDIACTAWARSWWNAGTRAESAATALMGSYDYQRGTWPSSGWWNTANALTSMIDFYDRTGSQAYRYVIARTWTENRDDQLGDFRADYVDDTGWWGLAWVRAYDVTGEERYLTSARIAADYMARYWDSACGGGVWWTTARTYKNAITNELFLKLTAALHNRIPGDTGYLQQATATWNWFSASGMINAGHLVNDGLDRLSCKNNDGRTWTYNQGVILGGLTELHRATGDPALLAQARAIAGAATTSPLTVKDGILTEPCGLTCSGRDVPSFKGAFARNLGELDRALPGRPYQKFLVKQTSTMWKQNRTSLDQYGLHWAGPLANLDASTQHSALDAFTAAL